MGGRSNINLDKGNEPDQAEIEQMRSRLRKSAYDLKELKIMAYDLQQMGGNAAADMLKRVNQVIRELERYNAYKEENPPCCPPPRSRSESRPQDQSHRTSGKNKKTTLWILLIVGSLLLLAFMPSLLKLRKAQIEGVLVLIGCIAISIVGSLVWSFIVNAGLSGAEKLSENAQRRSARNFPYASYSMDRLEDAIFKNQNTLTDWLYLKEELGRRRGERMRQLERYVDGKIAAITPQSNT